MEHGQHPKKHHGEGFDERRDFDATEQARKHTDEKNMDHVRRPDLVDPDRRNMIRGENQESRHHKNTGGE